MNTDNTNLKEFKIYIADLADYNMGLLEGVWLDITDMDADEIRKEIQEFLKKRTKETGELHEEFAIFDMEEFPDELVSEHPDFDELVKFMELTKEFGDAFATYCSHIGGIEYATKEGFEEAYCGQYKSEVEYAEEIAETVFDISESIACYFNYEKFAIDLFINDYYFEDGYVFRRI